MEYKGIKLKEVTEPQIFDPPKKMLVWGRYESITELDVYAITSRKDFPVICENTTWRHCAEIPEELKNHVTRRELARWLAQGNGEVKDGNVVYSDWDYFVENENEAVNNGLVVRTWDDTEWHNPTREYLGLDDK